MANKNDYFNYKDMINDKYLIDYINRTRTIAKENDKINCIYPERHKKGTDNNPSMSYDKKAGKYHCFSCDSMANIYDFIKKDNGLTTDTEAFNVLQSIYPNIERYNGNNDDLVQNRTLTPVQVIDNVEINTDYDFTNFINENSKKVIDSQKYIKDADTENPTIDAKYMVASFVYKNCISRGLTKETIKKSKIAVADNGFNDVVADYKELESKSPKQDQYKIIIPMLDSQGNCNSFIAEIINRNKTDRYNPKYLKPSTTGGLVIPLYNEYYLKTDTPTTIFITEGVYDALSIEQLGYNAIALLGIGNARLEALLKHYKPNANIVLMLDTDKAGRDTTKSILSMLDTLSMQSIKYIDSIDLLKNHKSIADCKDPNEMLLKDSKELKSLLKECFNIVNIDEDKDRLDNANISNNLDYFRTIEEQPKARLISTGFTGLNKNLKGGLRTGLYVLGAVSSLGKTAFLIQMADQIAKQGIPVLYFSLEMDKKELMARSIARTTYMQVAEQEDDKGQPIASDTFDVLDNYRYNEYSKDKKQTIEVSINVYENIAKHLYIFSGRYKDKNSDKPRRININDIEKIIKDFKKYNNTTPVIFLDYMQILAPIDPRATDKQNMDDIVDRLKQISIDYDTPVIAISSYNRDNYYEPANVSAFKESGAIEYGADYILALQYEGIDHIYYGTRTNSKGNKVPLYNSDNERRRAVYDLIEDYKLQSKKGELIPIELKLLKARNSSLFKMLFNLKARYGYFKEDSFIDDFKEWKTKKQNKDNIAEPLNR